MTYSKNDVVVLPYPFSDLEKKKLRPAIVLGEAAFGALFVVPITSKVTKIFPDEFVLENWKEAGLNVPSAVRKGIAVISKERISQKVGKISDQDSKSLNASLKNWLGI